MDANNLFREFMILLRKEFLLDDLQENSIEEILSLTKNIFPTSNSVDHFYFKKEENITSNSVFFISCNEDRKYSHVLKLRREDSTLPFDIELQKLNLLKEKIPKQFLNKKFENLKISIEEFISQPHFSDQEAYDENVLKILSHELAAVNSLEIVELLKTDGIEKSYNNYFYLDFLFKKLLPQSKKRFNFIEEESNHIKDNENLTSLREYFLENLKNIQRISNFLKEAEKYLDFLFPSANNKFLCLSLIDVHDLNFFIVDEEIKFIDFEDISYTFIGFDFANYLIDCAYTFSFDEYPFYYYLNIFDFSMENLKKLFRNYIDTLNQKSNMAFEYLNENDISKLFLQSIIKGIIEYVFMIKEDFYLKTDIDFILLIADRIELFEYYFELSGKSFC